MSARELQEWHEYWKIEPFGEFREDLRLARFASELLNATLFSTNRKKKYQPSDFIHEFIERDIREGKNPAGPAQTAEEIKNFFLNLSKDWKDKGEKPGRPGKDRVAKGRPRT